MRHLKESDLLKPVAAYARREGFQTQARELRFYDYRMDLYAFSKGNGLTAAFELKLRKWQRALQQALIYQLCSDYVFIAVPSAVVSRVDQEKLREHGVGLLSVSSKKICELVLGAERSEEVRGHYREAYIDALRGKHGNR